MANQLLLLFNNTVILKNIYNLFLVLDNIMSGNVGLVISQSLVLTGMLQIGVRQSTEVASNMISIERVLQYTKLEKETTYEHQPTKNLDKDWLYFAKITYNNPDRNWPQTGNIIFKNVFLRYAADAPPVLKNLNFEIKAGEKVSLITS